ncbi:hypothetical protein [Flavobacterium granuli]|uniref:hypothetical protein n=1 Tax=Flavobacterium granuli TaxID=280093 RepID=UPI001114D213|nr:hypothetical protein [Flavobacterium granuli]
MKIELCFDDSVCKKNSINPSKWLPHVLENTNYSKSSESSSSIHPSEFIRLRQLLGWIGS